ncbi:extracellular solute-binding protein [Paenibacillus sp. 1P07SE]|uniref:extracellular solute-binding protein n=1 Tax=Paenibacillus sp. 1P07SE TaxID=3132209 RepID=UPI0039A44E02
MSKSDEGRTATACGKGRRGNGAQGTHEAGRWAVKAGKSWLRRAACLGLLLAMATTACAPRSLVPETGPPLAEDPQPEAAAAVLEFWHTYSELEERVFREEVLPLFEEAHPDIRIHAVRKDYTEQLKSNVMASAADGQQPDVMRMDIIWVPEFAKQGLLTELSGLEGFEAMKAQFIGSLIETNRYGDGYYGLPVNANTKAAIFNMRLLREAGRTEPPGSFDELVAAQERLGDVYPGLSSVGICCAASWGTLPYFWTFGGQLTDEGYTRASGYLDSPQSLAAISKLQDWVERGIVSRSILTGDPGTWDGILKGELLMIDEAHWFYSANREGEHAEVLSDMVVAPFPDDVRQGTSIIGGENLVLFGNAKYPEEAWRFIRWMMQPEPQLLMARTGLIPTIREVQPEGGEAWFAPYADQLDRALPRPPVPAWTQIDDEFARMIERILTGEQPLEEAVRASAARIDALLAEG